MGEVNPASKGGKGKVAVYGVPRGGAIVAGLLDPGKFTVVDSPGKAVVVVDDLIDSGATAARFPDKEFFALIDKRETGGGWVRFPWELECSVADNEDHVRRVIQLCGDDAGREGMRETPGRYLKAMMELTSGYGEDPASHLEKSFDIRDVDEASAYDQIIGSVGIQFVSLCEHHLLPFFGEAHVGYIPAEGGRVVGLSKLARLVDGYSKRFQVQERLTRQIHDAMADKLQTESVVVILKATHTCQCWRGVKKAGSMVTSAVSGAFEGHSPKMEFMSLIELG